MTDLQAKLAALPKWPEPLDYYVSRTGITPWKHLVSLREAERDAALARLALLWEWVETRVPHLEGCPWRGLTRDTHGLLPDCRCGRDALLAATEVPK